MEKAQDHEDILGTAARWRGEGRGVALATVVTRNFLKKNSRSPDAARVRCG